MKINKKIFIFIFFATFLLQFSAFAKVLIVDKNYSFLHPFTCEGTILINAYNNINEAIQNADNDDTIKICKGTYYENLLINKNIKNLTITNAINATKPDDVKIISDKFGIIIGANWYYVENLTIENLSIETTSSSSQSIAIYFSKGRNLTLKNLNITSSQGNGIFSGYYADGDYDFNKLNISSKKTGIIIEKGRKVTLSEDNITISALGESGVILSWNVSNIESTFQNINISTQNGSGFIIRRGERLNFDTVKISNSISNDYSYGIYLDSNVSFNNFFKNLNIDVSGIGLYIRNGAPDIENSLIISRNKTAIVCSWNTYNVIVKNSKLVSKSPSPNDYGLIINNNQSNANVNNNCFYHLNRTMSLAEANKSGNNFDGNYWDGHIGGVYISGNIIDNHPLNGCPFNNTTTSNLTVNYQMDECEWSGIIGEVKDNSSNGYNGTAQNGANTSFDSIICKSGNFIGDNYIKPVINIPLPHAYTVTVWVKFPLDESEHNIYTINSFHYKYFNIADRVGSSDDFIYFKKDIDNNIWYICISGTNYDCQIFNMSSVSDGWHFLAFSMDGILSKFYLDGVLEKTFNQSPVGNIGYIFESDYTVAGETGKQTIGALADEFKIFNATLNSSEIQNIYTNESSGKNWDGSNRECICQLSPVADWHFDECFWNGVNGEVKDNTSNGYNGTAQNGANTVLGKLCRSGYFDGSNDYISVPNLSNILKGTASLSFWIKTTQNGDNIDWRAPGVIGVEEDGGVDDIFWGWIDSTGHIGISKGDNYNNSKSTVPINDGIWHHIVLTRNANNGDIAIYIDGVINKAGETDSGIVGTSFSSIGRIENTNPSKSPKYFKGYLDEIKVFSFILSPTQVQSIYNNEKNSKNWDGSNRICPSCSEIDHYEIIHDSNALTCNPENITVKACTNDNCSNLYNMSTTVTLNPSGWIGGDTKTFTGEDTFQLSHTTAETVTLGISNPSPSADYCCRNSEIDSQCVNDDAHCNIVFHDAGFIFDVPNQISCKPSENIIIKAVQKDDVSNKCIPSFSETTKDVAFWFDYVNPSNGANTLQLKGNNDSSFISISNDSASPTQRTLYFNNNGEASFNVKYNDAGILNLHAKYYDSNSGLTMTGDDVYGGSGDGFVVKPWAFYIDIPGNPAAVDANGGIFKKAGENFNMNIYAKCWESGDNQSNNSELSNNYTTPNYSQNNVEITHSLIEPVGGHNPDIPVRLANFSNGKAIIDNETFNEVGIISLTVTDDNYLSSGAISGTVPYVGRFIPDHFKITINNNGILTEKCSSFNYSGLTTTYALRPKFSIIAQNTDNTTTFNYKNDFFKLSLNKIIINSPSNDDNQLGTDGINKVDLSITKSTPTLINNNNGTATYIFGYDNITYLKNNNAKVSPFAPHFSFTIEEISDEDNVFAINLPKIPVTGNSMRYGRIKITDNYGPETDNLTLPITTQVWNGSMWELNSDDSCTLIQKQDFILKDFDGNLQSGETTILSTTGILNGNGSITLTAPGDGNDGSVDVDLNSNSLYYNYLFDNQTFGIATFGIYRGRDRIIMWQEIPAD